MVGESLPVRETGQLNGNTPMLLSLSNFVLFQIGWFACVLGSAYAYPWPGTLIAILIIGIHLLRARFPEQEAGLILVATGVGGLWDSLLVCMQWVSYNNGMWAEHLAPYWILALWALFATTLNVSLRWMKGRWLLAMMSGAVAGPLAYYAGHRLGAVNFSDISTAMIALSIGWAVFTPLLIAFSQRLDGYGHLSRPDKVFV